MAVNGCIKRWDDSFKVAIVMIIQDNRNRNFSAWRVKRDEDPRDPWIVGEIISHSPFQQLQWWHWHCGRLAASLLRPEFHICCLRSPTAITYHRRGGLLRTASGLLNPSRPDMDTILSSSHSASTFSLPFHICFQQPCSLQEQYAKNKQSGLQMPPPKISQMGPSPPPMLLREGRPFKYFQGRSLFCSTYHFASLNRWVPFTIHDVQPPPIQRSPFPVSILGPRSPQTSNRVVG